MADPDLWEQRSPDPYPKHCQTPKILNYITNLGVWFNGGCVGGPVGGADLAILLHKLERLDQPAMQT